MGKTTKIRMNDVEYTIHALNMREIKEITQVFHEGGPAMAIKIVEIALRRAEPKIENFDDFEPGCDLGDIVKKALELSGLRTEPTNPQEAVQPTAS